MAYALGVCAAECRTPCTVMTALTEAERADVAEACRLAAAFRNSALVQLRHTAPAGHGFGVPSPDEVTEAWQRSREGIARRGGLALAAMTEDGYPLPGLPSLLSAIAGRPLLPDTLLRDTAIELVTASTRTSWSARRPDRSDIPPAGYSGRGAHRVRRAADARWIE